MLSDFEGKPGIDGRTGPSPRRLLRWRWRSRGGGLDEDTLAAGVAAVGAELREVADLGRCIEEVRRAEDGVMLGVVLVEGRIAESDLIRLCRSLRRGDETVPVVLSLPGGPAELARLALAEGACDVLLGEGADAGRLRISLRRAFETAARQRAAAPPHQPSR